MAELQDTLYAQQNWGVLAHFSSHGRGRERRLHQARDVGVNPQGVQVYSFKTPSSEELDHDYLWRTSLRVPGRGSDRHLQSLLLRRSLGGAGSSGVIEE